MTTKNPIWLSHLSQLFSKKKKKKMSNLFRKHITHILKTFLRVKLCMISCRKPVKNACLNTTLKRHYQKLFRFSEGYSYIFKNLLNKNS